jgi:hypothetical protein
MIIKIYVWRLIKLALKLSMLTKRAAKQRLIVVHLVALLQMPKVPYISSLRIENHTHYSIH